jgi:hypothetical protein
MSAAGFPSHAYEYDLRDCYDLDLQGISFIRIYSILFYCYYLFNDGCETQAKNTISLS